MEQFPLLNEILLALLFSSKCGTKAKQCETRRLKVENICELNVRLHAMTTITHTMKEAMADITDN
jgi:hypothetical protein